MTRRVLLLLALGPLGLGWARRAQAQSVTPENAAQYFRIESEFGLDRKGRPSVWGYIYNYRGQGNARARILVETLDASGRPVAQEIAYVDTEIPLFNRAYFEMRPKTPGASYRVSIYSADWHRTGGI
jgi:hypothetical protein